MKLLENAPYKPEEAKLQPPSPEVLGSTKIISVRRPAPQSTPEAVSRHHSNGTTIGEKI